jgi:hypothetical protein
MEEIEHLDQVSKQKPKIVPTPDVRHFVGDGGFDQGWV